MKKNKILLIISIFVLGVSFLTGCGTKENTTQVENKTVANTLSETFEKEIKKQNLIENMKFLNCNFSYTFVMRLKLQKRKNSNIDFFCQKK